jgi:FkbM family methyltransferase
LTNNVVPRPRRGPLKNQALNIINRRGIRIGTVLDVGVLDGTPELKAHFPSAFHLLFEPLVELNPVIARNYRAVRHEIANVAVSDKSGETVLWLERLFDVQGAEFSHSHVAAAAQPAPDGKVQRKVPMTTLDDFLRDRDLPEPYLLKIDIDGHELAAIAGATETLKKCAVVIVEAQVAELPQRISAIASQGFVLFDLVEPCYYDHSLWQCDAVFLREDVHRRHFADFSAGFDRAKYSMFKG